MNLAQIKELLLSYQSPSALRALQEHALSVTLQNVGPEIHLRGLIEFSNICSCDCLYCGIRRSNTSPQRYTLSQEEILSLAQQSADLGDGSIALQSGERQDPAFVDFIEDTLLKIKANSRSELLPEGLGITLSVGQQSLQTYQRFFNAGAHRYLLRIESSSPALFAKIHPSRQTFQSRRQCLDFLKETGFQVGTGVMIGLPGQTLDDLARDILFFRDFEIDMLGMGPYLSHSQTPMSCYTLDNSAQRQEIFRKSLAMIAVARITCPKINIVSSTALQTIDPSGRIQGLLFGANVLMPQTTPTALRQNYLLYEGKPAMDENAPSIRAALQREIASIGRSICRNQWGDSPQYFLRKCNHSKRSEE